MLVTVSKNQPEWGSFVGFDRRVSPLYYLGSAEKVRKLNLDATQHQKWGLRVLVFQFTPRFSTPVQGF